MRFEDSRRNLREGFLEKLRNSIKITGNTQIVGLFGDPVKHTLSPSMHNAAFRHLGIDYAYLPFHVREQDLGAALKGIADMGLKGVNLTIPHKVNALKYVKSLCGEADVIGAINTVAVRNKKLFGYNTDGKGFISSLKDDCCFDPKKKNVLILGAGGAARAIAVQLAFYGAEKITIANRVLDFHLARRLAGDIRRKPGVKVKCVLLDEETLIKNARTVQLLVNATSVGLHPGDRLPLTSRFFDNAQSLGMVYDLIYNPPRTKLLRLAGSYGLKTSNGLGMLLYQGALAFEIWTGKKAPIHIMRKALTDAIKNRG